MGESSKWRALLDRFERAKEDHEERHRPSGFEFALASRIDSLNPAHWDAQTASASIFMQRRYLGVIERSGPPGLQPRYALLYRGSVPAAALNMQLVELAGSQLVNPASAPDAADGSALKRAWKQAFSGWSAKALEQLKLRVLVGGNLFSWGFHGVAFGPGEDELSVWPGIAEALYRVRQAERLAGRVDYVMVKDLDAAHEPGVQALKRYSYRALESDPDMVLAFRPGWSAYDDYLSSLNAKYRKAVKKFDKDLQAAGCTVEPLADLRAHAAQLHALHEQVHRRAATRMVALAPDYLPALAEALGADFRCTVVRRGPELLGFVTALKDGETAVGYYIGFDYAANETLPVYLRLLQAVIADGLALGCRRLSLGRTALEPKARLGAKPEPLRIWVRHKNPLLNILTHHLQRIVPHDSAPDRNPFKE
ncbi:MAG: GNAT family N-acetyltransferase [Planctomycetes bacterium]|nr:GNAT family N-acetyltransferase [Planctomycetota bacterium]